MGVEVTKDEILEVAVGRDLDVLVAKEIFGIEVEWDHSPWDINKQLPKQPYCKGESRTVLGVTAHVVLNTIPNYSTDISAAWQVVEKMYLMVDSEENQLLCCLKMHCDVPGEAWSIHWSYSELSIVDDGHKDHWLPLSWFSFPEAICRATLLLKSEIK